MLSFPVDDGAEMMVASTMLPFFSRPPPPLGQAIPDLPNGRCASSRRSSQRRIRLSPLVTALQMRRRNAGLRRSQGTGNVHPLRKDPAAFLAIAFEAGKGRFLKALRVVIPRKKGVVQNGRHAPDAQCQAQNQAVFRGSLKALGHSAYHPATMAVPLLYGQSRGVYSLCCLAVACEDWMKFMAVTARQCQDFRHIIGFF